MSEAVLIFVPPVNVPGAEGPLPVRQLFEFIRTAVLAPGDSERHRATIDAFIVSMVDSLGRRYQHKGTYSVQFDRGRGENGARTKTNAESDDNAINVYTLFFHYYTSDSVIIMKNDSLTS